MRALACLALSACGFATLEPLESHDAGTDAQACDQCLLVAIQEPIAKDGSSLELEGTFLLGAVVRFPGGATAPLELLGEHRAHVIVPPGAGAGTLTVDGAITVGPVPFRQTTFMPTLGVFRTSYEQAHGAIQTPRLVHERFSSAAVTAHGQVYVIGGGTYPTTIETARAAVDGTLGTFAISPQHLNVARAYGHSATIIGNNVYVIGGTQAPPAAITSIERATIADGGQLASFVDAGELLSPRQGHCAVVVGTRLYIIGGSTGPAALASIEYADISADGTIGPFTMSVTTLATARHGQQCVVANDHLFVIGGANGSDQALSTIEVAAIDGAGELGAFSAGTTLLEPIRYGHTAVVLGNHLFVVGGDRGTPTAAVEMATIDAAGTISAFSFASVSLDTPHSAHVAVLAGNYVYVLGGAGTSSKSIERASIAPGSLSGFTAVGTMPMPLSGQSVLVTSRSVYLLGGRSTAAMPTANVIAAPIGEDGTLGDFTGSSPPLSVPRADAATAIVGDYLYVMGGVGSTGVETNTIERAPIVDGTLGTFTLLPIVLLTPRSQLTASVVGTNVYVAGATQSSAASVERYAIAADGSLAAGVTTNAPNGRRDHAALVLRDTIFLVGGHYFGSTDRDDIIASTPATDGSFPAFATAGTIPAAVTGHGLAFVGNTLYIIGGDSNAVQHCAVTATGSFDGCAISGSLPSATAEAAAVGIGNYVYVFGGARSDGTSIEAILRATVQ